MHDQLLELYGDAFELAVERLVEQFRPDFQRQVADAFEANRALPCALCDELPIVGAWPGYNPRGSRQSHGHLETLVVQALCCRKWFEFQSPIWAHPLPLTPAEITSCYNRNGDLRSSLTGNYAMTLRGMWWEYQNATPFEIYCAQALAPPARDGYSNRKRRGRRLAF